MATLRERLETLPVAELAKLAEVREKLRLNAEERETLEATARKLLEALGMAEEPPPLPAPPPAPTAVIANPMTERIAAGKASYAVMAVSVLNSNLGKDFSATDFADMWNIRSETTVRTIRSALVRSATRGWIRRVKHGRYTSIYSGQPK